MRVELKRFLAVLLCAFATAAFVGGCSTGDRNSSRGINAGDDADPGGGGNGGNGSQCTEEDGLICTVQEILDNLGEDTPVEQLTDLINQLVDPDGGDLAAITEQLDMLTNSEGGLGALTDLVEQLANTDDEALDPLIDALNAGLAGDTEALQGLLDADTLTGLLGGLVPLPGEDGDGGGGGDEEGLINVVNDVVSNLGDESAIAPLTDVVNQLTDPDGGDLNALTGALNDLTGTESGQLGALTELADSLADTENEALEPLIVALNDLASGADPAGFAGEDNPLAGLLGGLGLPLP